MQKPRFDFHMKTFILETALGENYIQLYLKGFNLMFTYFQKNLIFNSNQQYTPGSLKCKNTDRQIKFIKNSYFYHQIRK